MAGYGLTWQVDLRARDIRFLGRQLLDVANDILELVGIVVGLVML